MKTWFWIGAIVYLDSLSYAHRNFGIIIDEVSVKVFNTVLLKQFDCQTYAINNRSYVDCQILLNRTIEKFNVRISLDFSKSNGPDMKLYDVHLEACSFVTTLHQTKVLNTFSKYIKEYSNLECPLKANFPYKLEKYNLNEQDFPSFVPIGSFRSLIQFYVNQSDVAARVKSRGRVVPRH
ncbi:uncharacterized protein Dana_GF20038 [Drosophila ananassae]|uniref:Uncharacterized protein n=1 Tax=Drosophila ananassae TaxID=7217 RepID=B3MVC5_DROAN|nr:uncharacterized protein Dana_GF20038 [Drosophila ananassae]